MRRSFSSATVSDITKLSLASLENIDREQYSVAFKSGSKNETKLDWEEPPVKREILRKTITEEDQSSIRKAFIKFTNRLLII